MREYKFRGNRTDNGELVYGFGAFIWEDDDIQKAEIYSTHGIFEVDPETVGQYTGLPDRIGKEIFDRDLVKIKGHPFHGLNMKVDGIYEVGYNDRMELCCGSWLLHRMLPYITVVGNKFDNPDMLEG
ncbi:YopX family protein [Paenibacillus lautus]|uniref:YopX family protein n=1 Tax=Paenibacillus lautus TaxID=1401 RepID=UPI003D2B2512